MSFTDSATSFVSQHVAYTLLQGSWPILDKVQPPAEVLEKIKTDALGSSIKDHEGFLSLGYFLISTDLLEPHSTQRRIDCDHLKKLKDAFMMQGILRFENGGVVIGCGDGWYDMKKKTPGHIMIDSRSPHIHRLSSAPGGPIGYIIRGGHRSAAIKSFSLSVEGALDQDYWFYNVLVPGIVNLPFIVIFITFL
jgi:hypothetical protein